MDSASFTRRFTVLLLSLTLISSISCSAKTPGQQKFGVDADYFMGLQMLKDGNEKQARSKFKNCIKKGSYYCARRSAETLLTFGSVPERNKAALELIKKYQDDAALLLAVKQFESAGETKKIVENTANLDFAKDKNELIKIRLEALRKQNSSMLDKETFEWFVSCPVSQLHYQFYRDSYPHPDFESTYTNVDGDLPLEYTPEQFVINYRIELYKRNYSYTFQKAGQLLQYFEDGTIKPCAQLASDLGKTYLYGDMNFANNAAYFRNLAEKYHGSETEFYFWFYSGRLYDKAGPYYAQSKNAFEQAITSTRDGSLKDNALWYLLNNSINYSMDAIIRNIGIYATQWSDSGYFDDFFESLTNSLIAGGRWDAFYDIYREIDGYASNEIVAQYAYLYARLVQEGLTKGSDEDVRQAFTRALNAGSQVYYKIMAAYNLGLKGADLEAALLETTGAALSTRDTETAVFPVVSENAKAAATLLEGYATFGFPELIYPEWQALYSEGIPTETYFILSDFLQRVGSKNYTTSLRIAARGQIKADRSLTKEEARLVYPKDYSDLVEKYSTEYGLDPAVMYALIRSESFFEADVKSSAGAIGLTQLMEFTGSDVASKLKMKEYDLTEPEDSIKIGTYYLAELVRRCDDDLVLGFFSYNAGITRVRRWLKSSLVEFGKKSEMPMDLFLETVPYSETREYGRKLVSATTMYEYLENPENFNETVKKMMKDF